MIWQSKSFLLSKAHCLTVEGCGHDPPSPAAAPGSWSEPLRQEIPLNLQLANLLVEPGEKGLIALLALVVVPIEDAGRPFQQGLLPGLDLAGMDLVPGAQLDHSLLSLQRLQGHLALECRAVFPPLF